MALNHQELIEVIRYLEDSSCEEFSLQMEGVDFFLRRGVAGVGRPAGRKPARTDSSDSAEAAAGAETRERTPARRQAPPAAKPRATGNIREVLAPMSGTFYRRPAPDAPPFVEMDSRINAGDPLCMIEVMKLFSTVYADYAGQVVSVEVDDAAVVEQGQVLLVIEAEES